MSLQIKQAINKDEIEVCNGWCDWDSCNIMKWLCIQCGNVECDRCIDDHNELVLTKEQIDFGMSICRKCKYYDSFQEYGEFQQLKEVIVVFDENGDKVIKD